MGEMAAPRVLISVVSWNSADAIQACLSALQAQTVAADILVVDNASSDGTLGLVKSSFPQVAIVALPSNTGFCGGHNVALRRAQTEGHDFVWLVNHDTDCAPDTLARLLAVMAQQPDCAVLSPVIVNRVGGGSCNTSSKGDANSDGTCRNSISKTLEFCGAALDPRQLRKRKAQDPAQAAALAADPALVPVVHGTAILLRRTLIDQIGLLNEGLFAYFDDDDLSARCHQAGATVRMCFDAEVWHDNPPSTQRGPHYHYLMTRNRWLFWASFFGGRLGLARSRRLVARTLREAGSLAGRGQVQNARAVLRGLADALRGRSGAPPAQYTLNNTLFKLLTWHPYFMAQLVHADGDV